MPESAAKSRWLTRERLLLGGLLVFALVLRGGVLWAMRDNLQGDPDMYREIAENLLHCGEFARGKGGCDNISPTAYRPPLYPVVLSNLPAADGSGVALWKIAVLHVLLGVATVWLTYLAARRMLAGQIGPLLAGLLVACDPILLNQQTLVMTETLAAFLAVLSLWCLVRFDGQPSCFNAGLAGGAIGLAILCRPTFLPWLGLVAAVMLFARGRDSGGGQQGWLRGIGWRLANVAVLSLVAAATMSPWVIRNYREFGKPIATTTHGGYTLWLGNNISFYDWLRNPQSDLPWDVERDRTGEHFLDESMMRVNLSLRMGLPTPPTDYELFVDRFEYHLARMAIDDDPIGFLLASWYRIVQLWSPLPHKLTADESTGRRLLRYATAAWYGGVYVLAAVGVWRLRIRLLAPPWIWGLLLCLTFTAVHTLYWSNLRMRAPLMPFVALVAAAALAPVSAPQRAQSA